MRPAQPPLLLTKPVSLRLRNPKPSAETCFTLLEQGLAECRRVMATHPRMRWWIKAINDAHAKQASVRLLRLIEGLEYETPRMVASVCRKQDARLGRVRVLNAITTPRPPTRTVALSLVLKAQGHILRPEPFIIEVEQ